MSIKLQLRRGLEVNLPSLAEGEPGFCKDTYKLFIGSAAGNREIYPSGIVREIINVKDYGAKGDGSTNDSTSIQNAFTAAGINKAIYFPPTYPNCYRVQNLTPLEGQELFGVGHGSWIKSYSETAPAFLLTNGNINFRNLWISHDPSTGGDAVPIKWIGAINSLRIHQCWISGGYFGLRAIGGGEISITDSQFVLNSTAGIMLEGCYEVRIIGSYIGEYNGFGIRAGLNGGTRCKDIVIIGNTLAGNNFDAVEFDSVCGCTIFGNTFDSNSQFVDNTYHSISLYNCKQISIVGNTGNIDTVGSGKDVSHHVYFYGNTPVGEVQMIGNTWPTPKTAEVYYAIGSLDADAHSFNTPRIVYNNGAPTAGTWKQGDMCFNTAAAAGGPSGWVCTIEGTPGTWKALANLAS